MAANCMPTLRRKLILAEHELQLGQESWNLALLLLVEQHTPPFELSNNKAKKLDFNASYVYLEQYICNDLYMESNIVEEME